MIAAVMHLPSLPPPRCRFPLWGDERPTHVHCGAPTIPASAYCLFHHVRCYRAGVPPLLRDVAGGDLAALEVPPC